MPRKKKSILEDAAPDKYSERKERERQRQARMSIEGRDIAPVPKCRKPAERKKCTESLKYFAMRCFPEKFKKKFSPDHEAAIAKMEAAVRDGALFALAMPRGSGKSTLIVVAVIWAILCGHKSYVALIGPTAHHAKKMLRSVKIELEHNDDLFDLFPEAVWPFRCLGGQPNKCRGQLHEGQRTCIEWGKELLVFATLPNAACSGAVIETAGLTGSIRGMNYAKPDGTAMRPDLVVIDDPQTKRSAKSDTQCDDRLETIQGDILGLAGPGESISGFVLCTVIRKGDVADRLLDRKEHPEWQGDRYRLVYDWPTNTKLWDEYAVKYLEGMQSGLGVAPATEFYREHRRAMDAGARVAWEDRYKTGELSALQHAYNLLLQDDHAFWCEYQNEPTDPNEDTELLSAEQIAAKCSGYHRGVVPPEVDTLTAFIDIQKKVLYWMVVGWRSADFSGWVVDWGAWPDQGLTYWTLAGVRQTLAKKYPRMGTEGRTRAGLVDLIDTLVDRVWESTEGNTYRIKKIGVDAGWGETSKIVQQTCRQHAHASILMPSFGRGITPTQAPIESWGKVDGERRGLKLVIRPTKGGGRHLLADANYWKTFIFNRFATAIGDPGALVLPKPRPRFTNENRILGEHCRAETRKRVSTGERSGDVWTLPPHQPDNHLFDCLVNNAVMAASEGVLLREHRRTIPVASNAAVKKKRRSRVSPLST